MAQKNLKVALFSQNTITNLETLFTKMSISSKPTIPSLTDEVPDIFVEMSQEDSRMISGIGSIIDHKDLRYEKKTIALNSMGGIDKNVIMQMYYKPELISHSNEIETGFIVLPRKSGEITRTELLYATKGAVYIYIRIPGYKPLLFINMHLPIDTKEIPSFGYEHRKYSFLKVVTDLGLIYKPENTTIIIGGDLNFRIVDGKDQLTELLKTPENPQLSELEFPDPNGKIFTCKFTKNNETCRKQPEPESIDKEGLVDENTITKIKENVQDVCGDKDKFPSRCDRFLTNDPKNIKVKVHKGDYIPILTSDHNSIYALLEISPILNGGKRNKKSKRTIKKGKMNKKRTNRRR
jgi:hypothetical protein